MDRSACRQRLLLATVLAWGSVSGCDAAAPGQGGDHPPDASVGGAADLSATDDFGGAGSADLTGGGGANDLAAGGATDLAGGGATDLARGGGGDLASGARDLASGGGVITGGPCASGATGATAIRVRWVNAGGIAQVQYEAFGMPDHSVEKVGAYGYQIGFMPPFVDTALAEGGLQLDSNDFVDIELSARGIASITRATLAIYGRSYAVSASGSFNWLSFTDSGETPTDFVSNVPPYRWYLADIGKTIAAGDAGVRVRIKAGPSSDALAVNRIEICLVAR
jgi:hypothetical protein